MRQAETVIDTYGPGHIISYNIPCASSKDSDQPAQADQSLRCPPEAALDPWLPTQVSCKDSDQTAWMRRLISFFAGHTRNLSIANDVPRLTTEYINIT